MAIEPDHVVMATGAQWRRDGFGRSHPQGLRDLAPADRVYTPDDIMQGHLPEGRIAVFDDDYYYMAAVIAERLHDKSDKVTLVSPEDCVASWGSYTAEQVRSQRRLMEMGVGIITSHSLDSFDGHEAGLSCGYTGRPQKIEAESLVLVTARQPNDSLYRELEALVAAGSGGSIQSLRRIGDCDAPAVIAAAVLCRARLCPQLRIGVPDRGVECPRPRPRTGMGTLMFHMLSCFDLDPDVDFAAFRQAYQDFLAEMRDLDLVVSSGPIGARQSDTPMDTDAEREHDYFVIMNFRDRAQVDAAYAHIESHREPGKTAHHSVYGQVRNPVFICWQDIE